MKKIMLLALAVLTLFACAKEDKVTGRPTTAKSDAPVFNATTEGAATPETKVYADDNLLVLWNEDDRISIFNRTTFNYEYIFTGEDGDNAGGYEEVPVSGFMTANDIEHIFAVYPYKKSNRVDNLGKKLTVILPDIQEYKEKSFGIGANTMVAMTDDYFLAFKNVCGYLKFRFYGDDVTVQSVTLQGNNGEQISGKAFVTPAMGGTPTTVMDSTATRKITINCPDPVTLGPSSSNYTEFIFVIPPTTFTSGFKVRVTDVDGKVFEKSSTRSLTISRNRLESMGAMKVVPTMDNVYVEFEDSNFKAYCVENFDTNGDGEISYAEAQEVTRIDVYTNNPDIYSMKGIEVFKNLTYLRCRGRGSSAERIGKLTSLDLSGNLNLDTLDCINNQLTSLDVSNNSALIRLSCYNNQINELIIDDNSDLITLICESNQLEELDISGCPNLDTLICNNNQLTQLDISSNTAMKYLDCLNNQISELNVSNNINLTCLNCTHNQLTDIDVSNNTNLNYLHCASNLFTELDISNNIALIAFSCQDNQLMEINVSNNTELSHLYCNDNQLTELDISNNTALRVLYCNSNQLASLDVRNNTILTVLCCNLNQLSQLDVSNNTALRTLSCYGNQLLYLDLRNNTLLKVLYAWPNDSLARLWKKSGQKISYYYTTNSRATIINPEDPEYGTEIIEVD